MKIWIKVPDSQEFKINCNISDDIDDLKEKIKIKLSPLFDLVPVIFIIIRDRDNNILEPDITVNELLYAANKIDCLLAEASPNPIWQGKIRILYYLLFNLIF